MSSLMLSPNLKILHDFMSSLMLSPCCPCCPHVILKYPMPSPCHLQASCVIPKPTTSSPCHLHMASVVPHYFYQHGPRYSHMHVVLDVVPNMCLSLICHLHVVPDVVSGICVVPDLLYLCHPQDSRVIPCHHQEISVVPHLLYQHGPRCSP